jgi:hypothetical protein
MRAHPTDGKVRSVSKPADDTSPTDRKDHMYATVRPVLATSSGLIAAATLTAVARISLNHCEPRLRPSGSRAQGGVS